MKKIIALIVMTTLFGTMLVGCKEKVEKNGVIDLNRQTEEGSDLDVENMESGKIENKTGGGYVVQSSEKLIDEDNQLEVEGDGEVAEPDSTEPDKEKIGESLASFLKKEVKSKDLYRFLKDNDLMIRYDEYSDETKKDLEDLRMIYVGQNIKDWEAKDENGKIVKPFDYVDLNKNTLFINSRFTCPHCVNFAKEVLEKEVMPDLWNTVYYQTESDINGYKEFRKDEGLTFKLPTFYALDDSERSKSLGVYDGPVPIALLVTHNGYIYDLDIAGGSLFNMFPMLDRTLNVVE